LQVNSQISPAKVLGNAQALRRVIDMARDFFAHEIHATKWGITRCKSGASCGQITFTAVLDQA
jgi:hypothetical protein